MRSMLLFIFLLITATPATALDYQGNCQIVFHVRTTLQSFQGTADCQPFTMTENNGSVEAPEVLVAVAGMDTNNARRDRQMRDMFEESRFPLIVANTGRISLSSTSLLDQINDPASEIRFQLKIRDILIPVTATINRLETTEDSITAELTFPVSLADFQLSPPSVMGFIRVLDRIDVTATLMLKTR